MRYGPWRCCGAKEALGIVRLLCSDTLHVMLCQLGPASPWWTFWSLLGGEGGRLEGLMRGPGSPRAPGDRGEACLLVSRPVRDPVGGAAGKAAPKVLRRGAPSLVGSGRVFLCLGLGWRRWPGRSRGPGSGFLSIGSLRLGRAPRALSRGLGVLRLGPVP